MKVKSYATLAFVNQRMGTSRSGGGNQYSSFVAPKLQLRLLNGHDHTNRYCHDSESEGADSNIHEHSQNRRLFFQTFLASMILIPMNTKSARAACLSGDIRTECIGFYKLPIDSHSPFTDTPETLELYAPDLQWVPPVEYPPNYFDAVKQLKEQREQLDTAQGLIAKGDMEKTGLVFLDIIPKVNAAGIVIMKSYGNASNEERNAAMKKASRSDFDNDDNPSSTTKAITIEMKAYQIEDSLNELYGLLGQTDILIGQGLRGELGVSAPAQIEILAQIAECRREFDNLLGTIPENIPT